MKRVYIASPLGFSESGRSFLYNNMIPALNSKGLEVLDPWTLTDKELIDTVRIMPLGEERTEKEERLNLIIGENNAEAIKASDLIIAVLDGPDVDSGTAAEIGYAAALGKRIVGYRSDFRYSSDSLASRVNLQVDYFIKISGGIVTSSLEALLNLV